MATDIAAEVAELQKLLAQTKTPGNRHDLEQLLARKQKALEAAEPQQEEPMQVDETLKPVKVEAASKPSDVATFSEISRFGWEDDGYGKPKVAVYIMSGVDGVGNLPKENVTCHFTKTSFDLKIIGLENKNYRLFKQHLEKEIDPAKSSFRVKKNRVTISLHKADKDNTWMNLTAKNPLKSSKPDTSDPAAGIMDMMKNMYAEGDDEMKRTIAKAWSESRNKSGAASPF
ncbi:hypothetical protein PF005_g7613 [Phytophthora fragariae]|uniref:Calcyclin-binding protein n=2 Tax=Phytophthora TaxID=4783 RepID=A0A6A3SY76_9STRA|nr:hypothetical protein PF003_g22291 [Phytophthora fragariae]KAE9042654.1 hypothetical protein PR001_g6105 [Phytophthora rubi]KAE8942431.1 hypothetical protein PF009_g7823 [Phytophthora fragariae]KAE9014447.1 hypothetical protein PF011_g8046 [Phytophthora fragariae]KAE9043406.1 hypothetical protein PR002_g3364 [Phytophthora rubi]